MPKYLSGRVKRTPQNRLSDDRYQYLDLGQAEPNIGDPPTPSGTPGIPAGIQYQMVSVLSNPGERYWVPVGGGLIPGSISVYDEGSLVGSPSSITQLNFVGNAIEAESVLLGIAATITVKPPGNNGSVLYKDSDDFATSSNLIFNGTVGILTVGKGLEVGDTGLKVGVGGTFLTVTSGIGSVGIGITNPTQELDVNGDVRIRKTIYDFNNDPGQPSNILTKGSTGLEWTSNNSVKTGAGGTIYDVQYHNTAGLVDGAPNFVYRSDTSRVGIGSTQPSVLLDVVGISSFKGGVNIDEPYITGVSTFTGQIKADNGIVANTARVSDLTQTRVVFSGQAGELVDDSNFTYTTSTDTLNLSNVIISGQTKTQHLEATGISTLGNVKVDTNTITTNVGALILDGASGIVQSNAGIFVNATTDSTNKDTGALTVDGGAGIEKNLNVGQKLIVGGATTLASAGGITTTGGDLYVGNDLYVKGNFSQEQGIFEKLLVNPGVSTFKGDVEFWGANSGVGKYAYWDKSTNSFNLINTSKLHFGNSQELTIYHNGSNGNSYIEESHSTGSLYIRSTDMYFQSTGGSKNYAVFNNGDGVDLYFDNLKKFSTISTGATVYGTAWSQGATVDGTLLVTGTSNLNGDVNLGNALTDNIVFDGKVDSTVLPNTDSTYDLGSSTLRWKTIYADTFDGIENLTIEDLYVTGIATFKGDVQFHGANGITSSYWDQSDNSLKFVDNSKLILGDGNDLEIFSDNSSGQIVSDNLIIRSDTANKPHLLGSVGYGVSLYYDGNKKFETFDKGIGITGSGSVGGGVSFHNGANTYNTKIKALDSLTASYTLTLPPNDGGVGDLLKSDGSGNLDWISQGSIDITPGGIDTQVQYNDNGNLGGMDNFTYNKTSGDITISGASYNVIWDKSANALEFQDNARSNFGTGNDLQISHTNSLSGQNDSEGNSILDGGDWCSLIKEAGTGPFIFKTDGGPGTGAYQFYDAGWRPLLKLYSGSNARAALYWGGVEKLITDTAGISITGGIKDKDGDLGTVGQVLSSTGTELNWVDAEDLSIVELDVIQENYCSVVDSVFNPITITPTSVGVTTVSIATTSNAYGRKFVQANDPTSVAGGNYTLCDGDIWYDTSS